MGLDLDAIRERSGGPWQSVIVALIAELEEARRSERTAWRHAEAVRAQAVRDLVAEQRRAAALLEAMQDVRRMIAPLDAAIGTIDAAIGYHWAEG
jgi:hypothetical protein